MTFLLMSMFLTKVMIKYYQENPPKNVEITFGLTESLTEGVHRSVKAGNPLIRGYTRSLKRLISIFEVKVCKVSE